VKAETRNGPACSTLRVAEYPRRGPGRAGAPFAEKLWLLFLPLLFLPNLGMGYETTFGTLELSDYLIGLYLLLLGIGLRRTPPLCADRLGRLLGAFLGWALLGTLSINLRYEYGSDTHAVYFGLLKLAKLVLYGWAGMRTAMRLTDGSMRRQFHWSLLAVIAVLGVSLLAGPGKQTTPEEQRMGYKANNGVSVAVAIMTCYAGGLLASGYGSKRWRRVAAAAVGLGLAGSFVSGGRGGWLAAAVAALYLVWRRGLRAASVGLFAGFLLVGYISYRTFPEFSARLNFTLGVGPISPDTNVERMAGLDPGNRPQIWLLEGSKLLDAPVLGTGFFHRDGLTSLDWWGSHNFFLQIFLETGVIGGFLVLMSLARMWRDAGSPEAQRATLTAALRAALVAGVVGGMGGEYFYGGFTLLALFAVYAPTGGLPLVKETPVRVGSRRAGQLLTAASGCV
jgi:O-antigen ligase